MSATVYAKLLILLSCRCTWNKIHDIRLLATVITNCASDPYSELCGLLQIQSVVKGKENIPNNE